MIRILIAEDEEIIRSGLLYTIDWLSMNAVVVASAATGTEGLEKIKSLRPDIVITDIKMPGMSGLDMIAGAQKEKSILSRSCLQAIPISTMRKMPSPSASSIIF